jgi:hypothetical protein
MTDEQQLLGALDPSGDPLGSDPLWEPSSRYWLIKNTDDVPLRQWAEDRADSSNREGAHLTRRGGYRWLGWPAQMRTHGVGVAVAYRRTLASVHRCRGE